MSAIAAVLFENHSAEDAVVLRMLAAAPHRGLPRKRMIFGRAALGIAHDDENADASLASDGTVAAACCGSLDNRESLTPMLDLAHAAAHGPSDADLLIAAFHRFGLDFPSRLRGMFAAVLSDGERLWCIRDHLGLRSLFYGTNGVGLLVASEAKQVAAGADIPIRADRDVVEQIFWGDYGTACAIRGVERLMPATLMQASRGRAFHTRYWNPAALLETARPTASEIQEQFDALMIQSLRRCMTGADVLSLSGGIDSPTVAGYAAPLYQQLFGRPLPALSVVAKNHPTVDETEYIKSVVDKFGLRWHTYEQRVAHGEAFDRWVQLCDGPVPTVTLNEMEEAYSLARRLGFRTMLTGEWAEYLVDQPEAALVHLLVRGRLRALGKQLLRERTRGRTAYSIARELASVLVPRWLTVWRRSRKQPFPPWLDRRPGTAAIVRHISAPRHRWRNNQLAGFKGVSISLEANEVCEMLCGIRVRRPWADIDLWEFFLSLPAEVKYAGPLRKSILRWLARGRVPDVILDRTTKTVFNASVEARMNYDTLARWLRQPNVRLAGVDYALLQSRIDARNLSLFEYRWARDLASAHAFLELYGE